MSDDVLKLIPKNPDFIPPSAAQVVAVSLLEQLLPKGEMCQATVYDKLTFIDQGENLEAVICPICRSRTAVDFSIEEDTGQFWWYELIDRLEEHTSTALCIEMPTCSHRVTVMDIEFEWPAGFARFELSIYNPDTAENLSNDQLHALEAALGCELKQIRAHY